MMLAVVAAAIKAVVMPYDVSEYFYRFMMLVLISTYIIMLLFLSIGMFLSALVRRHKVSSGIGFGLIFGLYLASIIAPFSENTRFLEHLTPFMFFEASQILRELKIDLSNVFISILAICLALISSYIIYKRRDLYI
jgi:ABC-2 type transport system permease protein